MQKITTDLYIGRVREHVKNVLCETDIILFAIAVTSNNANRSCIKNINHGRNKFLLFSKYLVIQ